MEIYDEIARMFRVGLRECLDTEELVLYELGESISDAEHIELCPLCTKKTDIIKEEGESFSNVIIRYSIAKLFEDYSHIYVAPLFSSPDEAITIKQISQRLNSEYDYTPDPKTLKEVLLKESYQTKDKYRPILEKVSGKPSLYRIAKGLYEKCGTPLTY